MRTPAEEVLYQSIAFAYYAYSYGLGCVQSVHSHEVIVVLGPEGGVPDIVEEEQESVNAVIRQQHTGYVDFKQIDPDF